MAKSPIVPAFAPAFEMLSMNATISGLIPADCPSAALDLVERGHNKSRSVHYFLVDNLLVAAEEHPREHQHYCDQRTDCKERGVRKRRGLHEYALAENSADRAYEYAQKGDRLALDSHCGDVAFPNRLRSETSDSCG